MTIRLSLVRILLITGILALVGLYGYYCAREWVAKWAFAHRTYFAAEELILISVAQTDITDETAFLLDGGEFEWHGKMVDVLHREIRSDSVFVYGFLDAAETDLNQEVSWLYRHPTQPDPPSDTRIRRIKWFSPFVLPSRITLVPVSGSVQPACFHGFSFSSPPIQRPMLDVMVPPPDLS